MFTMATSGDIIDGITPYTSVIFGELDTLVFLGVGLLFGGLALGYMARWIVRGAKTALGKGRRRR